MNADAFLLFGVLAVKHCYLHKLELGECLGIQERMSQIGSLKPIGGILADQGYLTGAEVEEVLERQRIKEPADPGESMFGDLAVINGMACEGDVRRALKLKKRMEKRGEKFRIGEILVIEGVLRGSQRDALLVCQARLRKTGLPADLRRTPDAGGLLLEIESMRRTGSLGKIILVAALAAACAAAAAALVLTALKI